MLLSLFSSIAIAGIAVGATVPPMARDEPGFVIDVVETISCTPLAGASGTLVMKSLPWADTTLPDAGVPLALVDNVLEEDDDTSSQQTFIFQNCTSTFMNETPSEQDGIAVYYGQFTLASNSTLCLSSNPGQPTEQNIFTDVCSISDDSSQMLQFWKITLNTADPTALAPVDFVGKSARQTDSSYYTTDFVDDDDTNVAKINFVNSLTPATYYEINLVPTSD